MTRSLLSARARTGLLLTCVCVAGSGSAVAMAKHGDDDGTSTGTTGTTGTTEDRTGTTTTPNTSGTPSVSEIEADAVSGSKLKLTAETSGRVTSLKFTYRSRTYTASKTRANHWARTVPARGGDGDDDVIKLRVRACNGSKCVSKSGSDDA